MIREIARNDMQNPLAGPDVWPVEAGEAVVMLPELARRIEGIIMPVPLRCKEDRAAMAAETLAHFASRTGLMQDGEPVETVIVDFVANLMHLCEHIGLISPGYNKFPDLLATAEMHFEMDQYPDDE
ncbi:hypothetical protein EHJ13_22130 [Cronobacter dublinensis]|uniref:Uncharacterized protein n=1 Tax=Cronobacter dublinensis TaxID=413497 RepID=A0A9Q4T717_9ENTR|nr:hypothetical protein [Cronobacter dublinensis]EMA8657039.1 hypothetical protein [Cronobacter dublinensis]NCH90107.1 hypothetical protein [Cronobacter dublinensis]